MACAMKTKTIVIALLVFVAVVLLVSHNEKLASDSAAQAARAQSAATGAVYFFKDVRASGPF
jgi:hypothetical protein